MTAHAKISSRASNVQNISLVLLHTAFQLHSLSGGIFGWTATQVHRKVVTKQPDTILARERFKEESNARGEDLAVKETGMACPPLFIRERNNKKFRLIV